MFLKVEADRRSTFRNWWVLLRSTSSCFLPPAVVFICSGAGTHPPSLLPAFFFSRQNNQTPHKIWPRCCYIDAMRTAGVKGVDLAWEHDCTSLRRRLVRRTSSLSLASYARIVFAKNTASRRLETTRRTCPKSTSLMI